MASAAQINMCKMLALLQVRPIRRKNGRRNALTFSHDASRTTASRWTCWFRLRQLVNLLRTGALLADLAIDGDLPEEWTGKDEVFIDKLYYKFPVGNWSGLHW